MSVGMSERVFCVDLRRDEIDLMQVKNRRFMYHPKGLLIMGAEDTVSKEMLLKSHAEEYHEASQYYVLPPFDDFVRGWIGVGKDYKHGIIHFAPVIPAENVEMFDKAFDFIEATLRNKFTKDAVLRGFPGAWEQKIGEVVLEKGSVDDRLADAAKRCNEVARADFGKGFKDIGIFAPR